MENYTDITLFIKDVNKIRLQSKDNWYFINVIVNDKEVYLKGHKTWLQIFRVNNINYANCMDRTIKGFKEDLSMPFKSEV